MPDATSETTQVQPSDAQGVIVGGWSYVWGAYSVTWVLLLSYMIILLIRAPRSRPARPGGPQ